MNSHRASDPLADAVWVPPGPAPQSRLPGSRSLYAARPTAPLRDGSLGELESLLELNAVVVLEARPDVTEVRLQPPAVSYVDDEGSQRRHTVDLLATMRDGTRIAVLIKPSALARTRGTRRLLALLAAQVPRTFARRWMLLTEQEVTRDRVHDGWLVRLAREIPDEAVDRAILEASRTLGVPTAIRDLIAASGVGSGGLEAVARLVGEGALVLSGGGRLDHDGVVGGHTARAATP